MDYKKEIIGIVESEKTAIMMTCIGLLEGIMENYIWMGTSSLALLKPSLFECLKNRKIVLFPDLGIDKTGKGTPFQQWKSKSEAIKAIGCKIAISDLLEKEGSLIQKYKGFDLADFVIANILKKYKVLNWLQAKNPVVSHFISKFDLKLEKSSG